MRTALRLAATVVLTAGIVGPAASGAAQPPSQLPPPLVPCDASVRWLHVIAPNSPTVFGRVGFSGGGFYQVTDLGGRLPHWSKVALFVHSGRSPVRITVPRRWRERAEVNWSSGRVPVLRIAGCPRPPNVWHVYTGGFHVHEPACVPLIVAAEGRSRIVRFGIGQRCNG
jgi:hypothetical protein